MLQGAGFEHLKGVAKEIIEVFYRCLFWGVFGFIAPFGVKNPVVHVVSGLATMAITGLLIALVAVHKLRHQSEQSEKQ